MLSFRCVKKGLLNKFHAIHYKLSGIDIYLIYIFVFSVLTLLYLPTIVLKKIKRKKKKSNHQEDFNIKV